MRRKAVKLVELAMTAASVLFVWGGALSEKDVHPPDTASGPVLAGLAFLMTAFARVTVKVK